MTTALILWGVAGWWVAAARTCNCSITEIRRVVWMLHLNVAWLGRVVEHKRTGERALITSISRCNVSSTLVWKWERPWKSLLDWLVPWEIQIMGMEDGRWRQAHAFESKSWYWKPVEGFFQRHRDAYAWCERERTETP